MGRVGFSVVKRNEYGVPDQDVTLASGESFDNPMRVIPAGGLQRAPPAGMSDAVFDRDAAAVQADLNR